MASTVRDPSTGLPGHLLSFRDPLQGLCIRVGGADALSGVGRAGAEQLRGFRIDWLQNLAFQRSAVQAWMASTADKMPSPELLDGLFKFLCGWHGFAQKIPTDLKDYYSEWTSALAGGRQAGRIFKLLAPIQELAMLYATYAAALRERAHILMADAAATPLFGSPRTSTAGSVAPASAPTSPTGMGCDEVHHGGPLDASGAPVAPATAAVALLRRAAGVYKWLSHSLTPTLPVYMGADGGPVELRPGVAAAMAAVCLAEAQALTAARATEKGSSVKMVASLHTGCAGLFQEASAAASHPDTPAAASSGGDGVGSAPSYFGGVAGSTCTVSERLLRYLAASTQLQQAVAAACQVADLKASMDLGNAEAAILGAEKLLHEALKGTGQEAGWKAAIAAEQAQLALLKPQVQKDRLNVTYQPLPTSAPPPIAGRVLAVATDFVPQPATPPAAIPNAPGADKSGCCVQ